MDFHGAATEAALVEDPPERWTTARGRAGQVTADIASLLRIHAAGFEAFVFVLGPLLGGWRGQFRQFATL